jgi:uncharacterized protein YjiS (DUF1127 family)
MSAFVTVPSRETRFARPNVWQAARSRLVALADWLRSHPASRPESMLRLNDRLLRDVGVSRADLEAEAAYWPFGAPAGGDARAS